MNSNYLITKILGSFRRFVLFILLIAAFMGAGAGIAWLLASRNTDEAQLVPSQLTLPETGDTTEVGEGSAQKLTVNARLEVNGQFYLAPSTVPSNAKAGTLVFDQATSTLQYFNGQSFVPLKAQSEVAAPQGGVASLQGQTGAITLTPGQVFR